jgi:hypothetical protein
MNSNTTTTSSRKTSGLIKAPPARLRMTKAMMRSSSRSIKIPSIECLSDFLFDTRAELAQTETHPALDGPIVLECRGAGREWRECYALLEHAASRSQDRLSVLLLDQIGNAPEGG